MVLSAVGSLRRSGRYCGASTVDDGSWRAASAGTDEVTRRNRPGNHQRADLDSDATRIAPIADQPADLDGLLAPHGVGGPHVREVAVARPARPATTDGTDGADDGAGGTHPTGGGAPLHRQHLCPQRVTKWVLGWERRLEGRRQAAGEERHRVEWFWVKGHAGVYGPAEHRSRCHLSSVIGVLLRCDTIFSG